MTRLVFLLLALLIGLATVVTLNDDATNAGLPMVQTKAEPCAPLKNPCDVVDCRRVRPGVIA